MIAHLRQWRTLVRERANREWRELSLDVVDELACHLADLQASAIASRRLRRRGAPDRARRAQRGVVSRAVEAAARQARRRIRPRFSRRHAAADRDAGRDGGRRAVAGARHRRQHRDFLARQQPRAARAARQGTAAARDPRRRPPAGQSIAGRIRSGSELRQRPQLFDSAFAWDTASASTWPAAASRNSSTGSGRRRASSTRSASRRLLGRDVHRRRRSAAAAARTVRSRSSATHSGSVGSAAPADAIGRRLTLERTPFTIVGVMPPDFFGPDVGRRVDVVVPIGMVTPSCGRIGASISATGGGSRSWCGCEAGPVGRPGDRGAARAAAADSKRDAAARLAGDRS